jgi:hypothetical protein
MNFSKFKIRKVDSPPLIVIYGSPGIGKTAFSVGADSSSDYRVGKESHLLVNVDFRGGDRIECNRVSDIIGGEIKTVSHLQQIFQGLSEQTHDIKWVVFDDLTALEEMFVNEVCSEHNVDNLKKIEYGRGFELARGKWYLFFDMIKELQNEKPIGIILVGHTKVDTQKDPMIESYSRHDLQLDKRSKEIIKKSVDLIGFAHKKVLTKQVDSSFGKKEHVAVGKSERVITFAPDLEGFESKDRFNLPEEIALDWSVFEAELSKAMDSSSNVSKSKK